MGADPLPLGFNPPPGLDPLLAALLATSHERHFDMVNLVRGLPPGALDWRPAPDAASLAGLALHILDVEEAVARLAAGEVYAWTAENGSRMDESAEETLLVDEILRVDGVVKSRLSGLTGERLGAALPGEERTAGAMLGEDMDHCAMHYGQLQLTRHLWEAAHPEWPRTYLHWR
jgi:hypothetical protein